MNPLIKINTEIISLLEKHTNVLRKFKVRRIGLFGSFARGEQKKT